jgi:transketolase
MGKKTASTRDAYGKTLLELGRENSNIVALDADLSSSTRSIIFAKEFPERFFNMGIAEQDMMGTAAGLAAMGKIPFASTFAMFASGRCWDQIRNSISYARLNVKIVASHGGITVGEDGSSHQAIEDIGLMRLIPQMTVIVPADANEVVRTVRAAAEFRGPVYIRLSRHNSVIINENLDYNFKFGRSICLREGKDAAIFACGIMVHSALEAAEFLQGEGVSCKVINMHTIKPLDSDAVITACRETGALVAAEEHSIIGGLGSAISEIAAENFPVPIARVGVKGYFGESGLPEKLLEKYGLTTKDIVEAVKKVILKKQTI